jgi:phosphate ABC transporter phosphate-binding protein
VALTGAPAATAVDRGGAGDPELARAAYAQIEGTGSTWSELIVQQWIADVDASGMKVVYTGGGSSKGRKDFAQNSTDFAISEIPYQGVDEQGNADTSNGREYAYLPIVAGGTAFTYQLKIGDQLVRNLRLSGETITKIFTNQITNWNDPAITADNNGRAFPSLPITPVVRSDGSGTTAQFTTWMDKEYPSLWRAFYGKAGLTSYYPRKGRAIGQAGSDQVMNTIAGFAGNGTIGYVEYSYPVNKDYPVVKVLNKGGYYVEPTDYNTAVALTKAKINQDKSSPLYLTQILDDVYRHPDPRAYPISSYSYMIIPTGASDQRMTTAKRQTLADFMYYSLCAGQTKAGPYGYSPLPLNLVQAAFGQVEDLGPAATPSPVPGVNIKNPSDNLASCDNPTFVKGNLAANHLAQIAPMPLPCQKATAQPCGDDQTPPGTPAGNGAKVSTKSTGSTTTPATPTGTAPTGAPPPTAAPDPATGAVATTATAAAGATPATANAIEVSAQRSGDNRLFGAVAVAELVAIVLLPGGYVAWLRRPRGGAS